MLAYQNLVLGPATYLEEQLVIAVYEVGVITGGDGDMPILDPPAGEE